MNIMRSETSKKILLVCIIALLGATCSCSMAKGKEYGERAVNQFHEQFNAGTTAKSIGNLMRVLEVQGVKIVSSNILKLFGVNLEQ